MRLGWMFGLLALLVLGCGSSGGGGGGAGLDADGPEVVGGDGGVLGLACQSNDDCPGAFCNPFSGKCVECTVDHHCGEGLRCLDGACVDDSKVCVAGAVKCLEGPALALCLPDGSGWGEAQPCDDGLGCTNDSCEEDLGCVFSTSAAKCDDANPCTLDVCDPSAGCLNTWDHESCGQVPVAEVSPTALDFGMSLPGNREERALVLANQGLGTLELSELRLMDDPDGNFGLVVGNEVLGTRSFAPPLELAPGAQETFVVGFTPPDLGLFQARLRVATNDPNVDGGNLFVDLRGRGAEELCLNVWPKPLDFPGTVVGQKASATVTLDNCGQGSVPIYDIYLDEWGCSDLYISSHEGYLGDLEPGTFLVVGLVHEPDETGPCKGTLVIENGSADHRIEVPITALGVQE